jgi:hypothetical protein
MKLHFLTSSSLLRPLAAALALAMPGLGAGIGFSMYQSDNGDGTGLTYLSNYVDWSLASTVGTHSRYGTWTNPNGSATKFLDVNLYGEFGQPGRCYQLTGSDVGINLTADPIIWVKSGTGSGVWTKLADDINGAMPSANIFVNAGSVGMSWAKIRLAAYSSARNSEYFRLTNNWYTNDYNTCTGGTKPAAYIQTDGTVVIVRAQ